MEFNGLIFIGRFQPLHYGHLTVVEQALARAEKLLIFLGSAQEARTAKNYWTAQERVEMFRLALTAAEFRRVEFCALLDRERDEDWCAFIRERAVALGGKIGLIGHRKDASSYYLDYFSQWPFVAVENYRGLSATPLRQRFLAGERDIGEIPPAVLSYLASLEQFP